MEDKLRVCTYNVHQWLNTQSTKLNYEDICESILHMNADVVCMQEVFFETDINKKGPWEAFRNQYMVDKEQMLEVVAKKLNMNFVFGEGYWCFGNAILSRFPIIKSEVKKIYLTEKGDDEESERLQPRVLVSATISCPKRNVTVHCIHLDHINEQTRLLQAQKIIDHIQKEPNHIILGDFNALRREDYSEKEFQEITQVRANGGWELPKLELMNYFFKKLGYVDCLSTYGQVKMTSRFNTRVDYILVPPDFPIKILKCERLEYNASDHFPLLLHLKLETEA